MTDFVNVSFPTLDLQLSMFENFIKERGLWVKWEKAAMCPCVRADETSGTPKFNCGECYNGNRYVDPQEIKVAVTNISGQRNATVFGDLALGGIYLTAPGEYRLGQNDRITLLNSTARYAELCQIPTTKLKADVAPGETSLLVEHTRRFPTPSAGSFVTIQAAGQTLRYAGKTATTLTGIPVAGPGAITSSLTANAVITMLEWKLRYEPLSVLDARTEDTELVRGVDYNLVDQRIRFEPAKLQTTFTVLYESRPVYLVDSIPHEFRDQIRNMGVDKGKLERLPLAVACRKDFMVRVG